MKKNRVYNFFMIIILLFLAIWMLIYTFGGQDYKYFYEKYILQKDCRYCYSDQGCPLDTGDPEQRNFICEGHKYWDLDGYSYYSHHGIFFDMGLLISDILVFIFGIVILFLIFSLFIQKMKRSLIHRTK